MQTSDSRETRPRHGGDNDATVMHAQLLAGGMSARRFPGDVLLAGPTMTAPQLNLVGATSRGTTFAGMSLSRRLTSYWALCAEAGLAVPESKTFRPGALKAAGQYAESLTYPVLASGPKDERRCVIHNVEQLKATTAALAALSPPRSVVVRRLTTAGILSLVMVGSDAAAALWQPHEGSFRSIVPDSVSPEILEMARRATAVVPGLDVAEVRLGLDDPHTPAHEQAVVVESLNFSPRLRDCTTSAEEADSLAGKLLEYFATESGTRLGPARTRVRVKATFSGVVDTRSFEAALVAESAQTDELQIDQIHDSSREALSARLTASPLVLARVCARALLGLGPRKERAHTVSTEIQESL